ncbi:MAG TPA: hypothetical protein VEI07_04165 [Planctomycetaceae bacterium]|nr:hypothetical protein [Planctomycetaceae bacterium]
MLRPINPNSPEHGRLAAGLFAATAVMTGGGGICLIMALVFAKDIWVPIAILACGLGGLVVMLWLMLERPARPAQNSSISIYTAQKETLADHVESFEPRHRRRGGRAFGTNPPPSADSIRKIREDSNVWCPSDRRAEEYRKSLRDAEPLE